MSDKLTEKKIQTDIIQLLKNSSLVEAVTGEVYREGDRPRDSQLEDIVVIFIDGAPDQIETGNFNLLIYVPDIDAYGNGVLSEDGERTEQIEDLAQDWVDELTTDRSCYKFKQRATIYTEAEPDISQHFVVVKMEYKFFSGGSSERVLATDPVGYAILCDPKE